MSKTLILSLVLLFSVFMSVSIAATEDAKKSQTPDVVEQNRKAMVIFEQILDLISNSSRLSALPKLEAGYLDIINKYPQASVVPECYWRLELIYLNDYNPPHIEKAEAIYGEFITKFPDSTMKTLMEEPLSDRYYKNSEWDKLLKLYTPAIKQFIEKGKKPKARELFMYSEAKLNLGNLTEAEKGYKLVISQFPESGEARESAKRLEAIQKKGTKK